MSMKGKKELDDKEIEAIHANGRYKKGNYTELRERIRENQNALILGGIGFGVAFILGLIVGSKLNHKE